jgi:hypothetical protein
MTVSSILYLKKAHATKKENVWHVRWGRPGPVQDWRVSKCHIPQPSSLRSNTTRLARWSWAPHAKPEVQTLLEEYRKTELHRRRPGRAYDNHDTDNFRRGINKLRKGKLSKWVTETTTTRGLKATTGSLPRAVDGNQQAVTIEENVVDEEDDVNGDEDKEEENEIEDEETEDEREQNTRRDVRGLTSIGSSITMGSMEMIDGELVIETTPFEEVDELLKELEADEEQEFSDE